MTRSLHAWRVIFLLALLSLLLTWPLLPHIFTHAPGDGIDDPALAWNLWWAKHSWVDRAGLGGLAHNPFDADVMFYPISINLAFYTLTLLNGALSIPLQSALSLILTTNLLTLSSFVIGGFGAYLLALDLIAGSVGARGKEQGAIRNPHSAIRNSQFAIIPALLYAFASAKLFYVSLGQFNIASSQWLPFVALYLARSLRQPRRWQNGFMLGLFLLFQTWAELTFGAFGVLLIAIVTVGAVIYAGLKWIKDQRSKIKDQKADATQPRPERRQVGSRRDAPRTTHHAPRTTLYALRNTAIAAVMFIIGLAPYLRNMLPDMMAEGDFLVEGGGFSDIFSVDVLGFFFPTQLHPIFGDIIRNLADNSALRPDQSQLMVNKGQHLFLGYAAMLLAAYGLWVGRKRLWVWAVALLTGGFLLVSLGPVVRFNGYETGIPGVFPLLLKIPFFQANRYPSRYSVLILLGLAILVGLGALALLQRVRPSRRKWLTLALATLLLFEHLSIPLPLSDFRLPPTYDAVVADARPGAILDLPIGWRNGFNVFGKADTVIMFTQWWQTYHGKPRLGGNTSRNPEQKFQYFMENPVIGVLAALQDGREVPPADFARAQALAPDLLRTLNIHIVTLHLDKVPPDFETKLLELFPLDKVEEQEGVARYEARWPAERTMVALTADDPEMRTYLRQGWGAVSQIENQPAVWATRDQPQLVLPAFTRPTTLTLTLASPGEQTLTFRLDGEEIARHALQPGLNTLTLALPTTADGYPGHLDIQSDRTFDPAAVAFAPRLIGHTGAESPANIVVRSAGKDTGDFGHIYIDGIDHSPNRRGYNLVALDPGSGSLLAAANFDTHDPLLADESTRMAAWIDALPVGTIVAGAVRDAAALNLQPDAIAALHGLGVQSDIRGHIRRAHGFVGVKGAAPGSAAAATSDLWPVTVTVGDGLTEPTPAFALLEMRWELLEQ
ncbi:MAG TPA: hypothetical protein G4N94_00395 [Caldilineae bacterium]|nr:hypothetical protein [Caldilineae bacterium]